MSQQRVPRETLESAAQQLTMKDPHKRAIEVASVTLETTLCNCVVVHWQGVSIEIHPGGVWEAAAARALENLRRGANAITGREWPDVDRYIRDAVNGIEDILNAIPKLFPNPGAPVSVPYDDACLRPTEDCDFKRYFLKIVLRLPVTFGGVTFHVIVIARFRYSMDFRQYLGNAERVTTETGMMLPEPGGSRAIAGAENGPVVWTPAGVLATMADALAGYDTTWGEGSPLLWKIRMNRGPTLSRPRSTGGTPGNRNDIPAYPEAAMRTLRSSDRLASLLPRMPVIHSPLGDD